MSSLWSTTDFLSVGEIFQDVSWKHRQTTSSPIPFFQLAFQTSSRDSSVNVVQVVSGISETSIQGVDMASKKSFDLCGVPLPQAIEFLPWFCERKTGMWGFILQSTVNKNLQNFCKICLFISSHTRLHAFNGRPGEKRPFY